LSHFREHGAILATQYRDFMTVMIVRFAAIVPS